MRRVAMLLVGLIVALFSAPFDTSRQLIVVTTQGWNDDHGVLQRYEKTGSIWHKTGAPIPVKLGRNGLGWGIGLHRAPKHARYIKKEGDGRSPAGIFALKQAFGYAPFGVRYPYRVYKESDHCVDDVRSRYYNSIVDSTRVTPDYRSFEHMKFPKDYYRYGIVVDHNHFGSQKAVRGAGSCIFLHIKDKPTAGCTVMKETQIKTVIRWLDPEKRPLLLQGPQSVVRKWLASLGI